MSSEQRVRANVIGTLIDVVDWDQAIARISTWAIKRESRYVCICNVHSVVTAKTNPNFKDIVDNSDMATPDGAPVAFVIRKQGYKEQKRINGPDLMWKYCKFASSQPQSIYLYGGSSQTLGLLQTKLLETFPTLKIAGAFSPPYRDLTVDEKQEVIDRINQSGAGTVWVSLGCPKQEVWMAESKHHINAVMIGVGAAFDYHAGTIRRAPIWMQNAGLEWLYRLCSEPRRLFKRYLVTNTLFIAYLLTTTIKKLIVK